MADISAEVLINHSIKKSFPNDIIIGEEDSTEISDFLLVKLKESLGNFKDINLSSKEAIRNILKSEDEHENGTGFERYWAVDPIDGTKGFIRGDQYCVCIALLEKTSEMPVMAALGCPNLLHSDSNERGIIILAIKSFGVFTCKLGEELKALQPTQKVPLQEDLSKAIFTGALESSHTNPQEIENIKKHFGNDVPVLRMDSQCKYGILALNRAHVYYRRHANKERDSCFNIAVADYSEYIWDNAAGYLIVTEAGGLVTDFAGNDLKFPPKKQFKVVGGIVASTLSKALHLELIKSVKI